MSKILIIDGDSSVNEIVDALYCHSLTEHSSNSKMLLELEQSKSRLAELLTIMERGL